MLLEKKKFNFKYTTHWHMNSKNKTFFWYMILVGCLSQMMKYCLLEKERFHNLKIQFYFS
jgi:hypothetical protein